MILTNLSSFSKKIIWL